MNLLKLIFIIYVFPTHCPEVPKAKEKQLSQYSAKL